MKKRIYLLMLAILMASTLGVNAQVIMGSQDNAHSGAVLELKSATKGLLMPRISLNNVTVFQLDQSTSDTAATAVGMMIYNTNASVTGGDGVGIYVWNGTKWIAGTGTTTPPPSPCTDSPVLTITSNPAPASITAGSQVVLTANVTSAGSNTYKWSKNGTEISGAMNNSYTITSFTYGDKYSCAVTNSCGTTTVYWSACGAYIDGGKWLKIMCYNLGANENLDPFTFNEGLMGDLYQWGRIADGHEKRNSEVVDGPALDTDLDANGQIKPTVTEKYGKFITRSDFSADWRSVQNQDPNLWGNALMNANPPKSVNDPCPTGWKIPSRQYWEQIINNNTMGGGLTGATIGSSLFIPMTGYRDVYGVYSLNLGQGNAAAMYWASSPFNVGSSYASSFFSIALLPAGNSAVANTPSRNAQGQAIRCIAE